MPSGHFEDRTLWLQKLREANAKSKKHIDIDLLKKRYLVDKISTHKLQSEFGVSNSTLINRLKSSGVSIRGCGEAQNLIEHEDPIRRIGYDRWYAKTQSPEARMKRSISHTGKKFSGERKKNISLGIGRGYKNKVFKGKNAGYSASHLWINKYWKKSGYCHNCKKKASPYGKNSVGTDWANIDGKYNRDSKDGWKELCRSCHRLFDKGNTTAYLTNSAKVLN